LVLLSPFLLPGEFYEVSETNEYGDSLAGRLARAGVDVWLVDQRRTGLAPGDCETGAADCSVLSEWDFDAFSSDALFATLLASLDNPGQRPILGGFSAGANAALATVNRAPHWFSGLFLYEGTFYSEDPAVIAHNQPICSTLEQAVANGTYYDPSAAVFSAVVGLAAAAPNALSPIFGFPPGTTNQQALLYVFSAPPAPGALSPTPSFIRMIGDFQNFEFVYSNQDRLTLVGPLFDNYAPLSPLRDLSCGLAGVDDRHLDNLSAFQGDVLLFFGGTGFGQSMFDTAGLLSNAQSLSVEDYPDLGEADLYFHHEWEQVFYEPLQAWLDEL
jgi:pimeloyl-ACP methyl ester carboxylesterase